MPRKRIPIPEATPQREHLRQRVSNMLAANDDPFEGMGDFNPAKSAIVRLIKALEPKSKRPKPTRTPKSTGAKKRSAAKRRALAKKNNPAKPKKGKQVAKCVMVTIVSPAGRPQSIPLTSELTELLLDGWQIIGTEEEINNAHTVLNWTPEGVANA